MATYTNSLTSHNGEHRTHDATKMCPLMRKPTPAEVERMERIFGAKQAKRFARGMSSAQRGLAKHEHARRSRRFHTKNCQVYKADPSAIE